MQEGRFAAAKPAILYSKIAVAAPDLADDCVCSMTPASELDVDGLAGLFFEAAETERKLPAVVRKQTRAAWPDYPDDDEAYGGGVLGAIAKRKAGE